MTTPSPLEAIFFAALEKGSPGERAAYLDEACTDDRDLRDRVERMLAAQVNAGSFLEVPAREMVRTIHQPITEKPGTQIGPYKLLQQIGEGGMGAVYMAEQKEPVKRRVALKIIKPGMDTRQVIARFEAERQALAMMDHPNIARVLDAGETESDRPYFVMELVKGVPVTQYCDEQHLTPKERLELFVPICRAVQHAHQKGIIHRDLKPANILVALIDGQPVCKVIDFGIAKATNQMLTEKTMFTQLGQVVGTLEYMSPEQAQVSQLDVDTRSDIYSLGVLLYELVTGDTPFDRQRLRSAAFDEMLRIIREEEPPKPSTKLSSSQSLPSVAANRHVDPRRLTSAVRGELDWIVMKALEKDRARRYETADGFANDIRRYLNSESVEACPPSTIYRLRKFAQRNKESIVVAAVVAVSLILGIVGTTSQALLARKERDHALNEQGRAIKAEATAKKSRDDADRARAAAEQAKESESKLRKQRESQLAGTYVDRGLRLIEENDQMASLIWFVEALRLEQDDPQRALPHRIRLAATLRNCPKLVRVCTHTGPMRSVEFSPDGQYVLTRDHDNNPSKGAQIWEVATGKLVTHLVLGSTLTHVAFSPDNQHVVTTTQGSDGKARIWHIKTGQPVTPPLEHGETVNHASFSLDGRRLVTSSGSMVRIWDGATGKQLHEPLDVGNDVFRSWFNADGDRIVTSSRAFPKHSVDIWRIDTGERVGPAPRMEFTREIAVNVDPDRNRVVTITTGDRPKRIRVWDLNTASLITLIQPKDVPTSAAFSPDGKRIITPCYGPVVIWDAETGAAISSLKHGRGFAAAAFSPNGRQIATVGNWDSTCRVWEYGSEPQFTALRHSSGITHAEFSRDGRLVVTASRDRTSRVWDAASGKPLTTPLRHNGEVLHASFSPNSRYLATAGGQGEARVWDARTGQPVTPVLRHDATVHRVAFSPDSRKLVTASGEMRIRGQAQVWDATTGRPITQPLQHSGLVTCAVFSPDGRQVLTASHDTTAILWDAATGKPMMPPLKHGLKVSFATFSFDGQYIATSCWGEEGVGKNGTAQVWNSSNGKLAIPRLNHADGVGRVSFSPRAKRLVTAGFGGIRVWDTKTGQQLLTGMRADIPSYHAEFSSDGLLLASANGLYTARVRDAITGRPITPPLKHSGIVGLACFSPDGRYVLSASPADNTAKLWSLARDERPLDDLTLLAQLLAGFRIDSSAALAPLDQAEFHEIHEELQSKYGADLFAPAQMKDSETRSEDSREESNEAEKKTTQDY